VWHAEGMSWRDVLDAVDAAESWILEQSYWVQVPILLVVLVPLVWLVAGGIDRIVERILWPHTRREMRFAAAAAIARHDGSAPTLAVTDTARPAR
jgi:hypothetical protein